MLNILNRITSGRGEEQDLQLLEELAEFMEAASLCALGQSAPFPVASTLKYFREEYIEHIRNKKCPAGVCASLIAYDIDQEKCSKCGACFRNCPVEAINKSEDKVYTVIQAKCIKCGACFSACPDKYRAVIKVPAYSMQQQPAAAPATK
jgi:NAD-dependent dihydropyrimidine dehydrogenase PreA subunit